MRLIRRASNINRSSDSRFSGFVISRYRTDGAPISGGSLSFPGRPQLTGSYRIRNPGCSKYPPHPPKWRFSFAVLQIMGGNGNIIQISQTILLF